MVEAGHTLSWFGYKEVVLFNVVKGCLLSDDNFSIRLSGTEYRENTQLKSSDRRLGHAIYYWTSPHHYLLIRWYAQYSVAIYPMIGLVLSFSQKIKFIFRCGIQLYHYLSLFYYIFFVTFSSLYYVYLYLCYIFCIILHNISWGKEMMSCWKLKSWDLG